MGDRSRAAKADTEAEAEAQWDARWMKAEGVLQLISIFLPCFVDHFHCPFHIVFFFLLLFFICAATDVLGPGSFPVISRRQGHRPASGLGVLRISGVLWGHSDFGHWLSGIKV